MQLHRVRQMLLVELNTKHVPKHNYVQPGISCYQCIYLQCVVILSFLSFLVYQLYISHPHLLCIQEAILTCSQFVCFVMQEKYSLNQVACQRSTKLSYQLMWILIKSIRPEQQTQSMHQLLRQISLLHVCLKPQRNLGNSQVTIPRN